MQDNPHPQYHFLPPRNWMNDPNEFSFQWKGMYHLFYQHNPYGAFHANMPWGHTVTPDPVHSQHFFIALSPTPGGPDKDGVFSGYAINNLGIPTIVYTGVSPEVQCIATGADDLVVWKKRTEPVIPVPPTDLTVFGFRDPCVWRGDCS